MRFAMYKCAICGKRFYPVQPNQLYCSFDCRYKALKAKSLKRYHDTHEVKTIYQHVCVYCGKTFSNGRALAKYCSKVCSKLAEAQRKQNRIDKKKSPFYTPIVPDGFDWNDYGMPNHNTFLDKWEKDIPWYQAPNSIMMSIDPYPV